MKKRIAYLLVGLVVVYFIVDEFKGRLFDYIANNYVTRVTAHPSAPQPDQVCLTWSGDPRNTQAVQWRTAMSVYDGVVQYRMSTPSDSESKELRVVPLVMEDRLLENDPKIHRYTGELKELQPATSYTYRVGSKDQGFWSEWSEFTTAPDGVTPFKFVYMGDPQEGLEYWGNLLQRAHERFPEAVFYTIAGDIVNNGHFRNEWDQLLCGAKGVFERRSVVPSIGNHDYDKRPSPSMYLDHFALGTNGPKDVPAEHAYSFTYGNALFIVLDSNRRIDQQTAWLEKTLAESKATWKFAIFHHPAYSSAPHRDNDEVREQWGALFDKYHVDMALQGHDHAYLRTFPMKGEKRVESPAEGTIYVVSVSGTKFYEQEPHDYSAVQFANVPTYQVLDISVNPDRLTYRAYDLQDNIKDELIIEK